MWLILVFFSPAMEPTRKLKRIRTEPQSSLKVAVVQYLAHCPVLANMNPSMSMHEMSVFFKRDDTVRKTQHVLDQVVLRSAKGVQMYSGVFLFAYLALRFPVNVFYKIGATETFLLEASKTMVELWEKFLFKVRDFDEPDLESTVNDFTDAYVDFRSKFCVWQQPKKDQLVERISYSLDKLMESKEYVPAEGVDKTVWDQYHTLIKTLRSKMVEIAGQEALDAYDASRPGSAANV